MSENYVGYFRGRKTIQRSGVVGGARSVFVKLQGNKNELVYPTFGGEIKNPFKGPAKIFAGDLMEYRTDENGLNPEIYVLKTYKVTHMEEGISIENNGYRHIPFVGDKIALVNAEGEAGEAITITSVKETVLHNGAKVWGCGTDKAVSTSGVYVEVDADGEPYVKKVNAVAPTDLDMFDAPATGDEDYDGARYFYTPALGGLMYESKMSPVPEFAKKFNKCDVNGWFKIQSV